MPLSSFSGPECNKTKLDQDLSLWRPQEGLFFSSIKHHGSKCHPRLKPFNVTISFSLMTFSCWSFFRILISRIAVIGNCTKSTRQFYFIFAKLRLRLNCTSWLQAEKGIQQDGWKCRRQRSFTKLDSWWWVTEFMYPFLLIIHAHFLQCNYLTSCLLLSHVHLSAKQNEHR